MSNKNYSRAERVAGLLHRKIAEIMLIHREKPAFAGVTIVSAKVSHDLSQAKIYVTLFDETKIEESIKSLNNEARFLRHLLAKELDLRITPNLLFVYDSSIRYGENLVSLINAAVESDAAKH